MNRDMIFLSHANPEDNDFTRWLALQLAKDGYPVWCDLTQLLGGEDFWKDAESAIRTRTIKFVYVLSRTSNEKDGPRRELQIAMNVARHDQSLHDFIIPLHIDNLAHADINVLLTNLNAIPFERSWAMGYGQLLDVLEREHVPKKANFNPEAVSSWWRSQFSAERGVRQESDAYLSNLVRIASMPERLFLHTLVRSGTGPVEPGNRLPFAGFVDNIDLVTFASAEDIAPALGEHLSVAQSTGYAVCDLLQGKGGLDPKKSRYFLSRLLRECWERWIAASTLGMYALSNRSTCYFFKKGVQPNVNIHFTGIDGRATYRSVVGYATNADGTKRYWHFGIRARPLLSPFPAFLLTSHVIFTSNGVTPWDDHRKMHSARRRQCKSWFNPEWRDRLLATLHWLSQGNASLCVPGGSGAMIEVSSKPELFASDVAYADPPTRKERLLLADLERNEPLPADEDEEEEHHDEEETDEDEGEEL